MLYKQVITKLNAKKHLSHKEASWLMKATLEVQISDAQIASWLTAYEFKEKTTEELISLAKVLQKNTLYIKKNSNAIDTCGTGGDGKHSINISTLTGIILSTLNINVAKHGNRAVSSKCGSADLLDALGYTISVPMNNLLNKLKQDHFVFMFAPIYYPILKRIAHIRRDLKFRTVFNLLGPIINPMKASIRLLGVYDPSLTNTLAEVLKLIGVKSALVIHSEDGTDEVSAIKPTFYQLLNQGKIRSGKIIPPKEISPFPFEKIAVKNKKDAIDKAFKTLKGNFKEGIATVGMNVAAAKYLWDLEHQQITLPINEYIQQQYPIIVRHIESGTAYNIVQKWKL